jgi:photosystem II stability/assembly factor-like uncharacterized protein
MPGVESQNHRLYIGSHDGVCALNSSDGGKTWEASERTPLSHAASRLTASSSNPRRAYLAAYESGVYRTDDGGVTWQHLASYPSDYAHSVLVHPEDHQRVYVGSEPATIFSSRDGGETWKEDTGFRAVPESSQWSFHSETRDSHVRDLRMAPQDPAILYAGIEVGGMVRSRDEGQTWKQLPGLHDDIHCIGLSPARPQTVYVATARGPYRSDDEGKNWELINQGIERRYALHVSAAPEDADIVLLTVSENSRRLNPQLLRSTNGGRDWQAVDSMGGDDDMVVGIDWDTNNARRVYAGTDHGRVYYSDDSGESWNQIQVELGTIAVGALVAG